MTDKQAADQGWQVRRGEKGTQIESWEVEGRDRGESGERSTGADDAETKGTGETERPRYINRVYTVFNAKQIDNKKAVARVWAAIHDLTRRGTTSSRTS